MSTGEAVGAANAPEYAEDYTLQELLVAAAAREIKLGYETGADSPLMNQMLWHLDIRIENLWNQIAKAAGENGFNLVVCAAHGAPPEPPKDARARMAVSGDSVAQMVQAAMQNTGRHLEKYVYPFLYLDRNATSGGAETVRRLAADAALAHPAVPQAITPREADVRRTMPGENVSRTVFTPNVGAMSC